MEDGIVVLITASSREEAEKIAETLVSDHLAACVNVVGDISSYFFWDGRAQQARESLLVCKSRKALMERLIARVKSLHSYTVPEIIALPIVAGSDDYLAWVKESTKESG